MSASNFRIVETDRGFSIFEVYYDSEGQIIGHSLNPVIDRYAENACGVTDWLEAISLAAEKPSISLSQLREAQQKIHASQRSRENSDDE